MLKKEKQLFSSSVFFIVFFIFNYNFALASEAYFDLSENQIKIQTDFNGKEVIIFGITYPDVDTIVTIQGPYKDSKISKKERIFGFWFDTKKIIYKDLPTIFFIASSSPIRKILNEDTIIKKKLYFDEIVKNLITQRNFIDQKQIDIWNKNLIEIKKSSNFYKEYKLNIIDDRLFQTRIFFPNQTVPGKYNVSIYQIKNKLIISEKNKEIIIKKTGIGNKIYEFAHDKPAAYGILSIVFAIFAGLIAATAFRRI